MLRMPRMAALGPLVAAPGTPTPIPRPTIQPGELGEAVKGCVYLDYVRVDSESDPPSGPPPPPRPLVRSRRSNSNSNSDSQDSTGSDASETGSVEGGEGEAVPAMSTPRRKRTKTSTSNSLSLLDGEPMANIYVRSYRSLVTEPWNYIGYIAISSHEDVMDRDEPYEPMVKLYLPPIALPPGALSPGEDTATFIQPKYALTGSGWVQHAANAIYAYAQRKYGSGSFDKDEYHEFATAVTSFVSIASLYGNVRPPPEQRVPDTTRAEYDE